jgi:hypothetical protein
VLRIAKNTLFVLSLLVAGLTTVSALGEVQPESKLGWKAALYGRSTDDTFSSSRTVGIAGVIRAEHPISDSLIAHFLGGALLESGSSSSLFTNEFEPRSRLFLQEASLKFAPLNFASVKAGALDQRHHSSPLLLDGGTFPAALLSLDPATGPWVLHLDAQAAIPTSQSLSTRATGKENTPTLFTQKLIAGFSDESFRGTFRATHFEFKDLTRGVAQDSRFYGNTITGVGPASRFVYRFEGFEFGPDFVLPLGSSLDFNLGASALRNTAGPANSNQGLYGYGGFRWKGKKLSLAPKLEWYRNEADSAPAFYSSAKFGHNNREGAGASVRMELPQLHFDVKYHRSKLLEPRTFQKNRFDYLELTVEIPYAGF